MPKLLIIIPKAPTRFIFDLRWFLGVIGKQGNLLLLAAVSLLNLTDEDQWEITVVDEYVASIDFSFNADLVAITAMSCTFNRAVEISQQFLKKGVQTICGGIHVSLVKSIDEHAFSAIMIGEAETVWENVLRDAAEHKLKKIYHGTRAQRLLQTDLCKINRHADFSKYAYYAIQTTRGCPFNCDFCSVSEFNGKELCHRRVDGVIREINAIRHENIKIFFVDDNIIGNINYASELFTKLAETRALWDAQATVNIGFNPQLLKLASAGGCEYLFLGIESVNRNSLESYTKQVNLAFQGQMPQAIHNIRSTGIDVVGSFVVGGDSDQPTIFKEIVDFIRQNQIIFAMINILTPLPGTKLFSRLEKEGRILHRDFSCFDVQHVVFSPRNLSVQELIGGVIYIHKNIYAFDPLFERIRSLLRKYSFFPKRKKLYRDGKSRKELIFIFFRFLVKIFQAASLPQAFARIGFVVKILGLYFDAKIVDKGNIFYFMLLGINLNDFSEEIIKHYESTFLSSV